MLLIVGHGIGVEADVVYAAVVCSGHQESTALSKACIDCAVVRLPCLRAKVYYWPKLYADMAKHPFNGRKLCLGKI